jgi:cytochrome c oxidase assembly protein subunit 15
VILLVIGTIGFLVALHRGRAPAAVRHRAEVLLAVLFAQGAIGYAQYFSDVPPLLVGIHVAGAATCWIAVLVLLLEARAHAVVPVQPWTADAAPADAAPAGTARADAPADVTTPASRTVAGRPAPGRAGERSGEVAPA